MRSDFSSLEVNPPDYCWAKSSIKVTEREANGLVFDFLCWGDRVMRLMCYREVTSF